MNSLFKIIGNIFNSDNQRTNFLILFFSGLLISVVIRLFNLQVVNGNYYQQNYVQKSIKEVNIPAMRGNIYDKNGKVLAYNQIVNNVTITDIDAFSTTKEGINQRNRMYLHLANILRKYNCNIDSRYFVEIDSSGKFYFTTTSERQHKSFIANVYGRLVSDLDEGQDFRFPSNISAYEAFEYSKKRFEMDVVLDDNKRPMVIDNQTLLDMIGIHFTMRLTSYQKYQPTTISTDIQNRCATEILENNGQLPGVDIVETSMRRYNYANYFSHIIGYVGKTSENQINQLRKTNPQYELTDDVGLIGIEKAMETYLCGKKGYEKIIVDSSGRILEHLESKEPKVGNDVYLTISVEDQVASYHLAEQQLAGILASKIVNADLESQVGRDGSKMEIAATDAYYHLISNNVLDVPHFESQDAMTAEREIRRLFLEYKDTVRNIIYRNLMSQNPSIQKELSNSDQNYMAYVYNYLFTHDNILMSDIIDRDVDEYKWWKLDEISLKQFLLKAIEEGWIDTTKIYASDRYGDRDTIYENLVSYIMNELEDNETFNLLVYRFGIKNKFISGRLLLMAIYEQNVLLYNESEYEKLSRGSDDYVYTYFIRLIRDLKLKPSDLALDPCRCSVVITDVNTGKLRAMVSYPSYDNNLITNSKYFRSLNNNQSYPLVNMSTMQLIAPGSSFKPITAIACLEENVIKKSDIIRCTGIFKEIDPPIRCWAYPYSHDDLDLVGGIKNSCNFFFASLGHMMSTDENGVYSTDTGLRMLIKYAEMFGLNEKSGVELEELTPIISRDDPERSAMGQGTHAYNNVQLAKFTSALANDGHMMDLSLFDRVEDKLGNILYQKESKEKRVLPLHLDNINTVKEGMREVLVSGVARYIFRRQDLAICGKTGTAQERNDRPNHGVFVSFCPYQKPTVAVNVIIPFGYSSGNAAALANRVYNYLYGITSFDEVINRNADDIRSISVSD